MLVSIGCRVNSKIATKFRQWATETLNQHITQGYTLNQYLLDETSTTEDFSVVRQEGSRQVKRSLKHGNPDAIISVGYRVQSCTATRRSEADFKVNSY